MADASRNTSGTSVGGLSVTSQNELAEGKMDEKIKQKNRVKHLRQTSSKGMAGARVIVDEDLVDEVLKPPKEKVNRMRP